MDDTSNYTKCTSPSLRPLMDAYYWGDATETDRQSFELHLLECDACWSELQRLEAAVRLLRSDKTIARPRLLADLLHVKGLAGRLSLAFGGHATFVIACSIVYGLTVSLVLPAELAYELRRFSTLTLTATPVLFVAAAISLMCGFGLAARGVRQLRAGGYAYSLIPVAVAIGLMLLVLSVFLPSAPIVKASFQTYSSLAGIMKGLAQAFGVAALFILVPFHCVLSFQRELVRGRHRALLGVLTGERLATVPRGVYYIKPRDYVLLLIAVDVCFFVGSAYLFNHLEPSTGMNTFLLFGIPRLFALLGFGIYAIAWYSRALEDLKQEAIAGTVLPSPTVIH